MVDLGQKKVNTRSPFFIKAHLKISPKNPVDNLPINPLF